MTRQLFLTMLLLAAPAAAQPVKILVPTEGMNQEPFTEILFVVPEGSPFSIRASFPIQYVPASEDLADRAEDIGAVYRIARNAHCPAPGGCPPDDLSAIKSQTITLNATVEGELHVAGVTFSAPAPAPPCTTALAVTKPGHGLEVGDEDEAGREVLAVSSADVYWVACP